jgi:hypothetical protein
LTGALAHIMRNNIGYPNKNTNMTGVDTMFNTWDLDITPAAKDFASIVDPSVSMTGAGVESSGALGPRAADGSMPAVDFLKLAAGSAMIDKGTDVGLPFVGAAPDLGAYEYGAAGTSGTGGVSGSGGSTGTGGATTAGTGGVGTGGGTGGGWARAMSADKPALARCHRPRQAVRARSTPAPGASRQGLCWPCWARCRPCCSSGGGGRRPPTGCQISSSWHATNFAIAELHAAPHAWVREGPGRPRHTWRRTPRQRTRPSHSALA